MKKKQFLKTIRKYFNCPSKKEYRVIVEQCDKIKLMALKETERLNNNEKEKKG